MNFCRYTIISIFILHSFYAGAQDTCSVPLPPVLTLVSVNPETGAVSLNWDQSPSTGIAAYIIYTYKNDIGIPLDTIWDPSATSYTYGTPATSYFSVSYVVAAHRKPSCTSPLSNHLSTIFVESEIDTCNKKITVRWNSYISEKIKVTGYKVLASVNGGDFSTVADIANDQVSYIIEDFITGSEYSFIVVATLEDGASSKSRKSPALSTAMQRPPDWINADYATIIDTKINLSFSIDPQSDIKLFSLERKTGNNGSFTEITRQEISAGSFRFSDDKADVQKINYYRLSAINSCNNHITVSNIASNIVLSLDRNNNEIKLKWNRYREWLGTVKSYKIQVNTGPGFVELSEIPPSDTTFVVDYRDIMYKVTADKVCFRIGAEEIANPHGADGNVLSQVVCTNPVEIITVPDVFTPNNDLVNDLFRPILSFSPVDYQLIISNRQGKVLFETKDFLQSWDGSANGRPVPQGVYLWNLKVTTPSNSVITRTGIVTVYFNK